MKKRFRIKKNHEIKKIIDLRESVGDKYFVIYRRKTTDDLFKFAISISKKYGTAVERNYAKRCVREIVRKEMESLKNLDIIIIIKNSSKYLSFSQKQYQLQKLFIRANKPELQKFTQFKRSSGGQIKNEK